MIKVGVIGASGYAGAELVRLLTMHPEVELTAIASHSYVDIAFSSLYPGANTCVDLVFQEAEDVISTCDIIFASLPHGHSEPLAKACLQQGKKFIDLGADFRLDEAKDYETWYGLSYQEVELHKQQVYGLPEFQRKKIQQATLIGNPGCYPTACSLALYPLMKHHLLNPKGIIIDAKSGVTGAGKGLSETGHFPRCNESFHPYKVAQHRHTPEIEQTLSYMANETVSITFVPHLLPINRGIITTIYVDLKEEWKKEDIFAVYHQQYEHEPFVRVLEDGACADLKFVQYSNYCDISLHFDERNQKMIIVSAIDNMVKGAAGQAIQNMNIMCNLDETTGLRMVPPSF